MTWLLLRGLARESAHWGDFPQHLEKTLNHKVICLDLPGFGNQRAQTSPLSIPAITEDLRSRLGTADKIGILGVSMGGMVALDWAHRYPKEVSHLVLVNTSAKNLGTVFHRLKIKAMGKILQALLEPDHYKREETILSLISNSPKRNQTAKVWGDIAKARLPDRKNVVFQLLAAAQFKAPFDLKTPTLVLCSEFDRLASYQCSETLAQKLGATLKINHEAGHDLPHDDPQWLMDEMAQWLKSPLSV